MLLVLGLLKQIITLTKINTFYIDHSLDFLYYNIALSFALKNNPKMSDQNSVFSLAKLLHMEIV